MEMITCDLCAKPFATTGPKICPRCMKRLDAVYEKARSFMRDNPDESLDVIRLADQLSEDVRDLEMLVQMGRFDRDVSGPAVEDRRKKQLLEELQKNLSGKSGEGKKYVSYGEERYGKR
jgi:hypothetical protein